MTGLCSPVSLLWVFPDLRPEQSISEFELSTFLRALLSSNGHLHHCIGKSKLMNILWNLIPQKSSEEDEQQPRSLGSVIVIDGMVVIQLMGKPTWARTG